MGRLGRIEDFILILGRVRLGHLGYTVGRIGSGRENWTHVKLCCR